MIELFLCRLLLSYPRDSFYYNDLRKFYYSNKNSLPKVYDWHTIERAIRKFAEKGILRRERSKRKVKFYINKEIIKRIYEIYKVYK